MGWRISEIWNELGRLEELIELAFHKSSNIPASVAGTGFWRSLAGVLQPTASRGLQGQVAGVNSSGSDILWQAVWNTWTTVGGGAFTPSPDQTALLVDTTGPQTTITTPANPYDGQMLIVYDYEGMAALNPIILNANVANDPLVTIDDPSNPGGTPVTSGHIAQQGMTAIFKYFASAHQWQLILVTTPYVSKPNSWAQLSWFVNATTGSNKSPGTTSGAPLQTISELMRRWGTLQPALGGAVTVTFQGDMPITDPWPNVALRSGSITLQGTLIQQATATIGTFTPRSETVGAGTRNTITAQGAGAGFWTALVGMSVHDTAANAQFFVDADLGGSPPLAAITEPVALPVGLVPALQAIANGDALTIFRPSNLYCEGELFLNGSVGSPSDNIIQCTVAPVAAFIRSSTGAVYRECVIAAGGAGATVLQCVNLDQEGGPILSSCYNKPGQGISGSFTAFAGSLCNSNGNLTPVAGAVLDGFVVCNAEVSLGPGNIIIGFAYFGVRPIYHHVGGGAYVTVSSTTYGASPFIWGAATYNVDSGATLAVGSGTAASAFKITLTIDSQTTAFTFNPATGAFSAGAVPISAATIDTNVSMQNPATGSRIVVITGQP